MQPEPNFDDSGNTGSIVATGPSGWPLVLRLVWIAIRLVAVFALANEFQPFFYQAF